MKNNKSIYYNKLKITCEDFNRKTGFKHDTDVVLKNVVNFFLADRLKCPAWTLTSQNVNKAFHDTLGTDGNGTMGLT